VSLRLARTPNLRCEVKKIALHVSKIRSTNAPQPSQQNFPLRWHNFLMPVLIDTRRCDSVTSFLLPTVDRSSQAPYSGTFFPATRPRQPTRSNFVVILPHACDAAAVQVSVGVACTQPK
jgi:hypothetical protein